MLGQLVGDRSRLVEPLRGHPLPPGAPPVLLALVKEGGSEGSTAAAILADGQIGESASAIAALLEQDAVVGRRELIAALGGVKSPEAIAALGKELFSDSASARAAAAEALAAQGESARSQLEALDALKGDYALKVREAATSAVSKLAPAEGQR